ncbi:MAG: DUF1997 domain-containing protein [Cyanobacteriota bacterium]|nr:DUF1997 domain-containing protein [Cyanobacteriota bacterium]
MSIASSKPVAPPANPTEMPSSIEIVAHQQGQVDLDTDVQALAHYLNHHQSWIHHCFKPLQVEALSEDTYRLQFFRIGGMGFELEPCFGVKIWPEDQQVFRLSSIELPSDAELPYKVDCQSYFQLEALPDAGNSAPQTRVHWDLKLRIGMELPGFLLALPRKLVHKVGSRVVNQVTRSMSDRLTHNVCTDFYKSINKAGRKYRLISLSHPQAKANDLG